LSTSNLPTPILFHSCAPHLDLHSFPTRRSSDLDLYRWRGLDDKEVLLWHLPRAGYEIGATLPADAERLFAAWAPVRGVLVQRATGKHVPVFIGADHHGAHPDVPRLRDLLAELDPQS